ncbi:FtsX-like permease family protein [Murimonas intestini]|uniref:ABC transport system permease protein n=1 Tax=Murimonas intestini TaxID=1337051 RepID=A0AB73SYP8_9FIRM|nr:FtsX-like permease family protein [Murimonas intestini]MCR1840328.1 FtsX-like permease family protein [Murimonas intestini]MCR1868207.1 FtsX-like permease family protein [Murimonas intestini]MCR1885557.1 FtsX-like permease family protein [Murimonas intestini]
MKKRALRKDFFMEIRKSLNRFISIFFIVALGVAFYSGIQASAPDMRYTGDAFYDERDTMDLKVISTLGITDKDVEALKALDGIDRVEPGYMLDAMTGSGEDEKVLHIESVLPEMNKLTLSEGEMPQNEGECFLDSEFAANAGYKVGDTLTLRLDKDTDEDTLKTLEYKISGIGSSPAYISFSRGSTNIGTGEVSGFAYILPENFDQEVYTQAYMKVKGAQELVCYSQEYEDLVAEVQGQVEGIEDIQCEQRYNEILDGADDKIAEAQSELDEGQSEADQKLSEAESELIEGESELAEGESELAKAKADLEDAQKELADSKATIEEKQEEWNNSNEELGNAWQQYADGKAQLEAKEAEYNASYPDAQAQIDNGWQQLSDGKAQLEQEEANYNAGVAELQGKKDEYESGVAQIAQARQDLEAGEAQLAAAKQEYDAGMAGLDSAREQLAALQQLIDAGSATEEQIAAASAIEATIAEQEPGLTAAGQYIAEQEQLLQASRAELDAQEAALPDAGTVQAEFDAAQAQLDQGKNQLDAARTEIANTEAQLTSAQAQLDSASAQLQQAREELASNEAALAAAQTQLDDGAAQLEDGRKQIADGEQQIADGEKEIEDAEKEIAENKKKLEDGRKEYEQAKIDAQDELEKGRQKIEDAKAELADLEMPEWIIYDRSSLSEYTGFGDNADRMKNIGEVFPVLFFLVAALISLTTMTRMVEEERTQIGTMKALGYSKWPIMSKYVYYALLATVGGSVFGALIGEKVFPWVIIRAYEIMYHIPNLEIPYNLQFALIATGAAVFCTMAATLASCYKELSETPASLMRPPAPKQGKRVLLERVTFIWKHLSFTWKSTIRNLFRYKKRFFMTIFGIGGCMALMLVGFGIRDSVTNIAVLQYGELQLYDGMVILNEDASDPQIEELEEFLSENPKASEKLPAVMKKVKMTSSSASGNQEVYLVVPENLDDFSKFFVLRDRRTKTPYTLDDSGIVLAEKTAKQLGAGVGDTVEIVEDNGKNKEAKVSAICENYVSNYAYMAPGMYKDLYGDEAKYNSIFFMTPEHDSASASQLGQEALKYKGALSVSYTGSVMNEVNDMLSSLDTVIVVLITSAGMLAFVVLYNLNNININERKRELATFKVLGFYDKEVSAYVYRENILLTLIGAAVGSGLGTILHRFVIVTVEVDAAMFGRNIEPLSFVYSILFTFAFSLFVNGVMYFKLKKIDMVESLKSIE